MRRTALRSRGVAGPRHRLHRRAGGRRSISRRCPSGCRGTARPARSTREGPDRGSPESSSAARCRGLRFVGAGDERVLRLSRRGTPVGTGLHRGARRRAGHRAVDRLDRSWHVEPRLRRRVVHRSGRRPVRGGQRDHACRRGSSRLPRRARPTGPRSVRRLPAGGVCAGRVVDRSISWASSRFLTLPAWWALGTWRMSPVGRGSARTFAGLFVVAFAAIVLSQFVQARLRDAAIGTAEPTATGDWGWP